MPIRNSGMILNHFLTIFGNPSRPLFKNVQFLIINRTFYAQKI